MPRYEDLETLIPDFDAWPGLHDSRFEREFLEPRLLKMGWTHVRFCCGEQGQSEEGAGVYSNRIVQVWNTQTGKKATYKYGRT